MRVDEVMAWNAAHHGLGGAAAAWEAWNWSILDVSDRAAQSFQSNAPTLREGTALASPPIYHPMLWSWVALRGAHRVQAFFTIRERHRCVIRHPAPCKTNARSCRLSAAIGFASAQWRRKVELSQRRRRAAGADRLARAFRLGVDWSNGLRHAGDRVQ